MRNVFSNMSALTNPKHEQFAQNIASGMTGKASAIAVGYAATRATVTGSTLLATGKVRQRVNELREQLLLTNAQNASYSLRQALIESDEALNVARSKKNANAMVNAISLKSKLAGLLVDRHQELTEVTELSDDQIDRMIAGRQADRAVEQAQAPAKAQIVESVEVSET